MFRLRPVKVAGVARLQTVREVAKIFGPWDRALANSVLAPRSTLPAASS